MWTSVYTSLAICEHHTSRDWGDHSDDTDTTRIY